jgi:hypothetical protein
MSSKKTKKSRTSNTTKKQSEKERAKKKEMIEKKKKEERKQERQRKREKRKQEKEAEEKRRATEKKEAPCCAFVVEFRGKVTIMKNAYGRDYNAEFRFDDVDPKLPFYFEAKTSEFAGNKTVTPYVGLIHNCHPPTSYAYLLRTNNNEDKRETLPYGTCRKLCEKDPKMKGVIACGGGTDFQLRKVCKSDFHWPLGIPSLNVSKMMNAVFVQPGPKFKDEDFGCVSAEHALYLKRNGIGLARVVHFRSADMKAVLPYSIAQRIPPGLVMTIDLKKSVLRLVRTEWKDDLQTPGRNVDATFSDLEDSTWWSKFDDGSDDTTSVYEIDFENSLFAFVLLPSYNVIPGEPGFSTKDCECGCDGDIGDNDFEKCHEKMGNVVTLSASNYFNDGKRELVAEDSVYSMAEIRKNHSGMRHISRGVASKSEKKCVLPVNVPFTFIESERRKATVKKDSFSNKRIFSSNGNEEGGEDEIIGSDAVKKTSKYEEYNCPGWLFEFDDPEALMDEADGHLKRKSRDYNCLPTKEEEECKLWSLYKPNHFECIATTFVTKKNDLPQNTAFLASPNKAFVCINAPNLECFVTEFQSKMNHDFRALKNCEDRRKWLARACTHFYALPYGSWFVLDADHVAKSMNGEETQRETVEALEKRKKRETQKREKTDEPTSKKTEKRGGDAGSKKRKRSTSEEREEPVKKARISKSKTVESVNVAIEIPVTTSTTTTTTTTTIAPSPTESAAVRLSPPPPVVRNFPAYHPLSPPPPSTSTTTMSNFGALNSDQPSRVHIPPPTAGAPIAPAYPLTAIAPVTMSTPVVAPSLLPMTPSFFGKFRNVGDSALIAPMAPSTSGTRNIASPRGTLRHSNATGKRTNAGSTDAKKPEHPSFDYLSPEQIEILAAKERRKEKELVLKERKQTLKEEKFRREQQQRLEEKMASLTNDSVQSGDKASVNEQSCAKNNGVLVIDGDTREIVIS